VRPRKLKKRQILQRVTSFLSMYTYPEKFNVIVVGAGHAGVEAALASARMGASTMLLTMNLDSIAQMSCNPAIGGLAKGQIVREIDALGGEMAKATDKTALQFRMLNRSRGPAVWSPRAQCDRALYRGEMKRVVENQPNLKLLQGEAVRILTGDNKISGIETKTGTIYNCDALILTTGTFLKGLVHIGLKNFSSGRMGEFSAEYLSGSLKELGFELGRLKTGTPPRLNSRTLDFEKLKPQYGDNPPEPFSHFTSEITQQQLPCWITYTNTTTHKIIKDNLDRSPLYSGIIKSTGPRYCPSIEDKVVRFADRERHQIFLEPEGFNTQEIYCNGISSSLPEDVQEQIVHSIEGCEKAQIIRYAYAIEYDFCQPTGLTASLETKLIPGLYFAGQINGTTGYEEAAGQGLMAGVNAVLKIRNEQPFVLNRDEAYLGVLIDDLVTKGVMDPYRMFTSRAEFRLILRSDNADLRLMDYGHKLGLIAQENIKKLQKYRSAIGKRIKEFEKIKLTGKGELSLAQYIRQGHTYEEMVSEASPENYAVKEETDLAPWTEAKIRNQVEIEIKYEGYIQKQLQEIDKFKKLENKKIPQDFKYENISGLLTESQLKLNKIKPRSIGQAARISGVTSSDIAILLVSLKSKSVG